MKKNKTFSAKECEVEKKWYLIDAAGQVLGRLATFAATLLRGKGKAIFTPHVDTGDFVVVINAEKIKVTGNKASQKVYFSHSGYPRGDKLFSFEKLIKTNPRRVIQQAVGGMLPKGRLGARLMKKLKIYSGEKHPHQAQKPVIVTIK